MQKRNWNNALALISTAASILYESNFCYLDNELEEALHTMAVQLSLVSENVVYDNNLLLFYDGFGLNSRGLIQIYLSALCKYKKVIYVTVREAENNIPDVLDILKTYDSEHIFLDSSTYLGAVYDLNKIVRERHPAHLFFYSVPNDVVGTVIMNAYEGKIRRYQINLTDHAFWLGAKAVDVCIEFRNYGAGISNEYRKIPKEKLVRIPYYPMVRKTAFQGYPSDIPKGYKVVFSGGSIYKTNGGGNKYYQMVDYLLSHHEDVVFWYAGKQGSGDCTELKKILAKYPERTFWTEERTDLFQVMEHSYFYLSTYPMGGGLMTQYAAQAAKVPLSLMLNSMSRELLLNEDQLGINFSEIEEVYAEMDRLLNDEAYNREKGRRIQEAVPSQNMFDEAVKKLISGEPAGLVISYGHVDIEQFRNIQLENYKKEKMNAVIARKKNKILFRYFPKEFILGGVLKLIRELTNMK